MISYRSKQGFKFGANLTTAHRATSTHGQEANAEEGQVEEVVLEQAMSILSCIVSSEVRMSMLYGMKYARSMRGGPLSVNAFLFEALLLHVWPLSVASTALTKLVDHFKQLACFVEDDKASMCSEHFHRGSQ
jgi:hypothetical protein